jgi:hypothetical protein
MRRLAPAAALALALLAPPALADEPAIRSTIQSQIDAFLADDFETAFTYASPGIKGMFRTPERFGEMVRSGYPMVWRPAEVRWLDLRRDGARIVQRVMIIDQRGGLHLLDYLMIEGPTGWQIAGVQLLRNPVVGA